jgi:hypothetical protein
MTSSPSRRGSLDFPLTGSEETIESGLNALARIIAHRILSDRIWKREYGKQKIYPEP